MSSETYRYVNDFSSFHRFNVFGIITGASKDFSRIVTGIKTSHGPLLRPKNKT